MVNVSGDQAFEDALLTLVGEGSPEGETLGLLPLLGLHPPGDDDGDDNDFDDGDDDGDDFIW